MIANLARCPMCTAPIQIVSPSARESTAVHVVDSDGRRYVAQPPAQLQFTDDDPEEAGWTLQRWWAEGVRPRMVEEGRSAARIGEYETYLRRWEQCCLNHWTACPVVRDVSPATLGEYRTYLVEALDVSSGQADKHVKGVSSLLQRAADDWIIERVPRVRAGPNGQAKQALKWVFTPADLDALYAACDGVQWPSRFADGGACENPAEYWRLFLVAGWNFGFRPQEWWAYESGPVPITWGGISWEREIQVEGRPATSAGGWATWSATKTGHTLQLPLHRVLRAHLERVWNALPARRRQRKVRVFDFPHTAGTAKPGRETTPADGWYAAWWDLVKRAGLKPRLAKSGKHLTCCPSHFRKTAQTNHRDNVVEIDGLPVRVGDVADFVTGHAGGKNVSLRHYYRSIRMVVATCESLRQPSSFEVTADTSLS